MRRISLDLILGLTFICLPLAAQASEAVKYSTLGTLHVVKGPEKPKGVVLYLTSKPWAEAEEAAANEIAKDDYWVVGIESEKYEKVGLAKKRKCFYPAADFEEASKFVQQKYKLPTYYIPHIVADEGASDLAYASLAQAPSNTFRNVVTAGVCTDVSWALAPCKGSGLEMTGKAPKIAMKPGKVARPDWTVIAAAKCSGAEAKKFVADSAQAKWMEATPQFAAQAKSILLAKEEPPSPVAVPESIADLPLIELIPKKIETDEFAIFLSGDGGWAGIDSGISEALNRKGMPIIGWNSLKYFWKKRSPEELSKDLARIIGFYSEKLKMKKVRLIGFSFGADAYSFAFNLLPAESKAKVKEMDLAGLSDTASFEFHFSDWVSSSKTTYKTASEISKMEGIKVKCVYGEDEKDSACESIKSKAEVTKFSGGHHLGGNYDKVAEVLLR